jgi:hypothetical protein
VHTEASDYHYLIEGCANLSETTFLLADQCHERFFHAPCNHRFVYHNAGNIATLCLTSSYPHLKRRFLATAGSVATEAFSLALVMGCNPVVLVGQDLALTGGRYYAATSTNRKFKHGEHDRRSAAGYFGGRIETLTNYLHFIDWYDDAARVYHERHPDLLLADATEGGANLPGFANTRFQELLERFFTKPVSIDRALARAAAVDARKIMKPRDLDRLYEECLRQTREALKLARSFSVFEPRLEKELRNIGPGNLTALHQRLKEMERFNHQLSMSYKHFQVLLGYCDEEPRGKRNPSPPSSDLSILCRELTEDLAILSANTHQIGIAAERLIPILEELIHDRRSSPLSFADDQTVAATQSTEN